MLISIHHIDICHSRYHRLSFALQHLVKACTISTPESSLEFMSDFVRVLHIHQTSGWDEENHETWRSCNRLQCMSAIFYRNSRKCYVRNSTATNQNPSGPSKPPPVGQPLPQGKPTKLVACQICLPQNEAALLCPVIPCKMNHFQQSLRDAESARTPNDQSLWMIWG